MPKHKSISQRLLLAKSPEARAETLAAWIANWRSDQDDIVAQLEEAIRSNDYDLLCSATGQLKTVTEKRMTALTNVLRILTTPESET